jgi:hypothetical protein
VGRDRELVLQLLEDIILLQAPKGAPQSPALVRTTYTTVLRRWLLQGLFYKAQHLIRPQHEVSFRVVNEEDTLPLCHQGFYEHWVGSLVLDDVGISMWRPTAAHRDNPPRPGAPKAAQVCAKEFLS